MKKLTIGIGVAEVIPQNEVIDAMEFKCQLRHPQHSILKGDATETPKLIIVYFH